MFNLNLQLLCGHLVHFLSLKLLIFFLALDGEPVRTVVSSQSLVNFKLRYRKRFVSEASSGNL